MNSRTSVNSAYDWTGSYSGLTYASDGQNKLTASGSLTLSYDARGNLTSDSVHSYGYNAVNQMTTFGGSTTLSYDPLGRLSQTAGSAATRFLYDGADIIAEYNASGTMTARYVHGPGVDETLVWYNGSGTTNRQWLLADERGSVIAVTDGTATVDNVNIYDDYGVPGTYNIGRFQYTGQAWIPEIGLYSYKAREYSPTLGRFMQTDPVGYLSDANLYAYVRNDPVNFSDPMGLAQTNDPDDYPHQQPNGADPYANDPPLPNIVVNPPSCSNSGSFTTPSGRYVPDCNGDTPMITSGGDGGGGGGEGGGAPPPPPPPPPPDPCHANGSLAGRIGEGADHVSDVADLTAVAAAGAGAVTAPTVVAPVVFETVAVGAKLVAGGSTIVAVGAKVLDGNYQGAFASTLGFFVGTAAAKSFIGGSEAEAETFGMANSQQTQSAVCGGH